MAQIKVKEGTAPVSKYAKKRQERVAKEAKVKEEVLDVQEEQDDVQITNERPKTVVGKNNKELKFFVPDHIKNIGYIVKDNAAIRRHTSLNILNHLIEQGVIRKDGTGNYVTFLWNKFRVSSDGIKKEYSYRENFFLLALIDSFKQFAKDAENTIKVFMEEEGIESID